MPKAKAPVAAIRDQEYELVDIDEVKPHPDNPNTGDIEVIRASIRANGFYNAIKVQRSTGYILAGNTSWRAAKAEGLLQIPVIWLDVDPVEAIRILLVDNESARHGVIDDAAVEQLLADLGTLEGTGFDFRPVIDAEELEAEEEARLAAEAEGDGTDDVPEGLEGTQYGVVVMVEDEAQQEEIYNELKGRGFQCRVVSV